MEGRLITNIILLATLTCWQAVFSAKIEIFSGVFKGVVKSSVDITCLPDKNVKEVVGIQISREGENLASMRTGSQIVYGNSVKTIFTARGVIEADVSKCFLQVTLVSILYSDSNKYTCSVYFKNDQGFVDMETASDNLVVGGAKIDITSLVMDGPVVKAAEFGCSPGSVATSAKEIVGIQFSRGDEQMAYLDEESSITYGNQIKTIFMAEGHIDSDASKCFLRVRLPYVSASDGGQYTCSIHYISSSGFMEVETVSGDFDVGTQDLAGGLATMAEKIKTQENLINDQARKIENQAGELKEIKNQLDKAEGVDTSEKKTDLSEDSHSATPCQCGNNTGNFLSAFSASLESKGYSTQPGEVLAFRNVLTMNGIGYNRKTGVFTAPYRGLYAFHLSIILRESGSWLYATIQVNENVVARLRVGDNTWYEQSFTSCLVSLQPGDIVRAVVENTSSGSSMDLHDAKQDSTFSGYLLQSL